MNNSDVMQSTLELSPAGSVVNTEQEIILNDSHEDSNFKVIASSQVPAAQEFPISLPAALCDEELISEINKIPNKMGFKIGDVADMLGVKQYVLRYWESEFDVLKPKKANNNQRFYTRKDVENVYIIRKLLHRDRFSIEGARSAMKGLKTHIKKEKDWSSVNNRFEAAVDRVEDLILDIRRLRQLFK